MNDLLGGAVRGKTRPRGFVDWHPQAATRILIEQVEAILTEYADYLPLTYRQVFYRLVGAHGYDKTERAYERLCEMLNRARRARIINKNMVAGYPRELHDCDPEPTLEQVKEQITFLGHASADRLNEIVDGLVDIHDDEEMASSKALKQ